MTTSETHTYLLALYRESGLAPDGDLYERLGRLRAWVRERAAPDAVIFSGREIAVLRRVVCDAGQGPLDSDDPRVFWRNVRGILESYGRTAGLTDVEAQACALKLAPEDA